MGTTWITRLVHWTNHIALHITQGIHPKNNSGKDLRHSRILPQKIKHAKNVIYR